MFIKVKKLLFIATFNLTLFLILMIGIQNNYSRKNYLISDDAIVKINGVEIKSDINSDTINNILYGNVFGVKTKR